MVLNAVFGAVSNTGWGSWMRDLVPQERLGSFFSKRMRLATGLATVLSLAGAAYIDFWNHQFPSYELQGYSILFFLGFLSGMLGVYFILTIPEPRVARTDGRFFQLFSQPFRDTNFRNLMRFMGPWTFAVNLAAPFFTVYMLKRLQLGMSSVIGLAVLSQVMYFAFLRIWGKLSDRFSNKSVLSVSGPLFMLCILGWTFTTMPQKYFLTVPLLIAIHVFMGIATAGVNLSVGNMGLKLAPRGQATAFLAANSLANSVGAGLGPILGGQLADFFAGRELSWTLKWRGPWGEATLPMLNLQQWDFLFFFAFLTGLYSIHRLATVKELGEVKEKVVVQGLMSETRRGMRNLSTGGGLLQLVNFTFRTITQFKRKKHQPPHPEDNSASQL